MARYSIAGRSTVVGTSARAMVSLFASSTVGAKVREIKVYNTTTTALAVAVARFTASTNVGAGLTEAEYDEDAPGPSCTGFAGHTGDGTTGQILEQASLGAAIGSGVIWTYGDTGLVIQPGGGNGIGLTCPTGTGQICDYTITWDE